MCFLQECDLFIILDSHSHGTSSGLIATAQKESTAVYFEEFVNQHYHFLCFVPSSNKVAPFSSFIATTQTLIIDVT